MNWNNSQDSITVARQQRAHPPSPGGWQGWTSPRPPPYCCCTNTDQYTVNSITALEMIYRNLKIILIK